MAMLLPVAMAAMGGLASTLVNKVVSKIIGDAPPTEATISQIQPYLSNPSTFMELVAAQPGLLPQDQAQSLQNSSFQDINTALTHTRAKLLASMMPLNPSSQGVQNANLISNHLGQAVSDGAAMLQMLPQNAQLSRPIALAQPQPQYTMSPYQAAQQIQPIPGMLGQVPSLTTGMQGGTGNPQTSLVNLAAQPGYKLNYNQGVLLPPVPTGSTAPLESMRPEMQQATTLPGAIGQNLSQVANAVKDTATEQGVGAINKVGGMITGLGQRVVSGLIGKGTDKLLGLLGGTINGLVSKIIGDAVPTTLPAMYLSKDIHGAEALPKMDPSWLRPAVKVVGDALVGQTQRVTTSGSTPKIVGDAPPGAVSSDSSIMQGMGDVMTPQQSDAALQNITNSPGFALVSELVLQEQTLSLAKGLSNGMSAVEMNFQSGVSLPLSNASYAQDQVFLVNQIQGMMMANLSPVFEGLLVQTAGCPITAFNASTTNFVSVSGAEIQAPKLAPPVGGNLTLDTLKPLLLGAAVSEYSSALRLRNTIVDVDRMLKAFAITSNNLEAQTGYSFALPLTKILGYVLNMMPFVGTNIASAISSVNATFPADYMGSSVPGICFPWVVSRQSELPIGNVMKLAVVGEADFISAITGDIITNDWDPLFWPAAWGSETAIVYIRQNQVNSGVLNFVEMLAQLEYPVCSVTNTVYMYTIGKGGNLANPTFNNMYVTNLTNVFLTTAATRIKGPKKAVLFVVLNIKAGQRTAINLGVQNVILSTEDAGPAHPDDFDLNGANFNANVEWLCRSSSLPVLLSWIGRWEETFGNNSDRATALRFWADVSRLYGPGLVASNPLLPGGQISLAGYRADYMNGWNFVDPASLCQPPNFPFLDDPIWMVAQSVHSLWTGNNAPALVEGRNRGWRSLLKTASGLTPMIYRKHDQADLGYEYLMGPTNAWVLPTSDFMVDYLLMKKWCYTLEEYPTDRLADAARIAYTVAVMNNIMAAIVDLLHQSNDTLMPAFFIPAYPNIDANMSLKMRNSVMPGIAEILLSGIQFPTAYPNVMVHVDGSGFTLNANNIATEGLAEFERVYTYPLTDGTVLTSVARIPKDVIGDFSVIMKQTANSLRLNFPLFNPSRRKVVVANQAYNLFNITINRDENGASAIENTILMRYLSRLAQGVVVSGNVLNNGVFMRNKLYDVLKVYAFQIRFPNEYRDALINAAMGREGMPTPLTWGLGLPKGENVITRDPSASYSPLSLQMAGPIDAFGPGEGSYSYIMYYNRVGGFAMVTENSFTLVPESVFSGSAVQNMLGGF